MPRDTIQADTDAVVDIKNKAINKAIDRGCKLQDEEDALIEEHCAPIRKEKAELKAQIEKRYGIPVEAFNARAGLRRIELKKNNDRVLLGVNDLFSAVPVAHNVDVDSARKRIEAAEKAEADEKAKAAGKPKITETKL